MPRNVQIGESERSLQNRLVAFFCDDKRLKYAYLGNLQDQISKNIITARLKAFLLRKHTEQLANAAIDELVKAAGDLSHDLYAANKAVYALLKYGAKVTDRRDGKPKTVFFIDWETATNNDFAIAEEVTVRENLEKRPDIVIYVNGIALSVIELKKSTISVSNGIRQNIGNQTDLFIKPFFTTVQIVAAGNDSEGLRYGVIKTEEKYFLEWKNFAETTNESAKNINAVSTLTDDKLHSAVYSVYEKARFLDIVRNFIIFDKGKKKIARHNQYFGVLEAQGKIAKREGGIIWHTQGSGKSLTMVWLAKWILEHGNNNRILIITDREELDDQIEKTFGGVNQAIVRTKSFRDLIEKLNKQDDNLICSLVHKFGHRAKGAKGGGAVVKSDVYDHYIKALKESLPKNFKAKGDMFVFVDECHRTQSGKLHAAMKELLPSSIFIGFTGTPILKEDKKKSKEIFGDYIHTYRYNEAVRDNVVLDLRYEARDIPQEVIAQDRIDEWFEAKTRGLMPRAKAKLKQLWGNLQTIYGSKTRLERIVCDIVFDFEAKARLENGNGNAILVADSIYSACRYYEIFTSKGFNKCAIITSFNGEAGTLRTEATTVDGTDEAWEKYDAYKKMLNGQDVDNFEKEAKRKFVEEPANMKLLIVVDKLLTGFDAPHCTYLYVDKRMQDHGLFQAICRVNRLDDESKDFGYIVDYKKLFEELTDAVSDYAGESGALVGYDAADIEGLIKDRVAESKKYFEKTLCEIEALCEGVPMPRKQLEFRRYFCGENGVDPEKDEIFARIREKLYKLSGKLTRAYAELKPDMTEAGYSTAEQTEIENKVKFFVDLRDDIGRASGDFIDFKAYTPDMRFLIDNYIIADASEKLGAFDDFTVLDFIMAQDEKLKNEKDKPAQEAAAEAIENNIRKKIIEKQVVNPIYYEKMSAILQKLIEDRKNGVLAYKDMLAKYIELLSQAVKPEDNEVYPATVRKSAAKRAFYDAFGENIDTTEKIWGAIASKIMPDFRGNQVKENRIRTALKMVLSDDGLVEKAFDIFYSQDAGEFFQ
jgi:type I restriction enzyme R subunit